MRASERILVGKRVAKRVVGVHKAVRDPADPDLMAMGFNCGDGIHPSPAGYYAMGRAVDFSVFQPTRKK